MRDRKVIYGIIVAIVFFLGIGVSYAFFTATNDQTLEGGVSVEAGRLEFTFSDNTPEISVSDVYPGWNTQKVVAVENTGTLEETYDIVWADLTNTILQDELVISCTCAGTGTASATCADNAVVAEDTAIPYTYEVADFNTTLVSEVVIPAQGTHTYTCTITFKETNSVQNYNQGQTFRATLNVIEHAAPVTE